jgi:hypothetical protein
MSGGWLAARAVYSYSDLFMATSGKVDIGKEYRDYLARFESEYGDSDFGVFVKHRGRLVKKMRQDEFEPVYREFSDIAKSYFDSLDRGDTINDVVVKMLRERAIELLISSPV